MSVELARNLGQVPGVQVKGVRGRPNSFEVSVNGTLIHSKLNTGSFPDPGQVTKKVKEMAKGEKSGATSKPSRSKWSHH
ncbi:migration and invasion enhancer 1-like protein [Lates japonicus]|uniref:Migration and invasion enhancer 1-like protein n=1 Tax=Lates japonicus TaxID=270547 RepID=A0AAD3RHZ6_LATJO|nr:migration and invasion enhancer 1-like protein [Lates japonicus]